MTTALVGRQGTLATKARVALMTRNGGAAMTSVLARAGHELFECHDWRTFVQAANASPFDLMLCDEELVSELPPDSPVPVLVLSDRHGNAAPGMVVVSLSAIENALEPILALALTLARSAARCRDLEKTVEGIRSGQALIGRSPVMRRLHTSLSRAADCDATVLIEGPTGSGKSLAARAIHCKSRRGNSAVVVLESGAATVEGLAKVLEEARGTTLVIEDIDRLSPQTQALLVRHLKDRHDVAGITAPRVIATTAAHLPELVARGAFREDLYYRLHAMPIVVPGLRERQEDIAFIAQAIVDSSAGASGRGPAFTPAALAMLESMAWPGNITQLEATVRRAVLAAGGALIDRDHLQAPTAGNRTAFEARNDSRETADEREVAEEAILPFEQEEQRMLTRALRATKGNVRKAAQLLGIGRATLYRKIQQYRLRLQ